MVRAWYMDNDLSDPRNEHHRDPPVYVPLEKLQEITGVEYIKLNPATFETDGVLEKLRKERGYTYEDQRLLPDENIPNLEEVLEAFYDEHLHTDEEIRLVVRGSGYFDVRDKNDEWIRIEVVAGDLLILPGGIYHRFTLDNKNFICANRYFIGEPVWTAHNRPCDEMDVRKEYLHKLHSQESIKGH